jgi:hypothetical protein
MDNYNIPVESWTITAANSIFWLRIPLLYDVAERLFGWAADDVFTIDAVSPTEVMMGVDGRLSGGFVHVEKRMSLSLQADSPSNLIFENWYRMQTHYQEVCLCEATVVLPAINRTYTMSRGFLTGYPITPDVRRVLQPRRYQITFGRTEFAPGGAPRMESMTGLTE